MPAKFIRLVIAVAVAAPCLLVDAAVQAQPGGQAQGGRKDLITNASKDPAAAPRGQYKMDPDHTSILIRILHQGTSYSTFRFNTDEGVLDWEPARIEASKVEVTVDTKSIATPVAGFAERLAGERYLNSAKFPQARFVSTGIRRTGAATGEITGDLTFLGVTKPIKIDAQLVGIGPNAKDLATIGFVGSAKLKRSDFGLTTLLTVFGDEAELMIDTEFNRQG
jgi:polyisoprenoid-binding protein YceI